MTPEQEREAFEEAAFKQYFISTIKRNPNPPKGTGALDFISVDCLNKDQFLARAENGRYINTSIDAAWWAWQERAKLNA